MSVAPTLLPLFRGGHGSHEAPEAATRREARTAEVRLVEYCPYPRASAARGWQVGFTRDLSTSGMCLEADREQRVGSLLHLTLRSIDGRPALEALARVAWCQPGKGSSLLGLSLLDEGRRAAPASADAELPPRPGPRPARRRAILRLA